MKRAAGFTLIEVMAVVLVLGILAAFYGARYMDRSDEARAGMSITFLGGQVPTALLNVAEMRGRIDNTTKDDLVARGLSATTLWGTAWNVATDDDLTNNRITLQFTVGAANTPTTRSLATSVADRLRLANEYPSVVSVTVTNNQLDVVYRGG